MRISKSTKTSVKASSTSGIDDKALEQKWMELEDIPFDESADGELVLSENWWRFPAGTSREEIWEYFDGLHSKGVAWLVNNFDADGVNACNSVKASKKLSANDQALQHIKAAIDILGKSGDKSDVTKDSIANLGIVMFDLKNNK